jgi:surface protein
MDAMFFVCTGLTILDLSGFNTSNVTNMYYMFNSCTKLKTIFVGKDWSTTSVTNGAGMFAGSTVLVGGAGTHYDENNTDHTYAHIDQGTANPGYFTAAGAEPWVDPEATFDDYGVLTVGGATTMAEALEFVGGKEMVAKTITAIVWNSTAVITNSDMQGIDNPNLLVYVNEASLAPQGIQNVVIDGTAKEIILRDTIAGNNNWYCPQPFTAEKISYTRNFQQKTQIGVARGWESIALPFDVQTITYEDNRTITPFDNYDSVYHFWLRRLTQNGLQSVQEINANVAYVISMPNSSEYPGEYNLAGNVTFSAENAPIPETYPEMDESADRAMAPAFQRMEADEHIYALNVGEPRGSHPEGSVFEKNYREVRPFEAFTKHFNDNGSRFMSIADMLDGGVTGIEELKDGKIEEWKSESWYDLNGRRVLSPSKGVYIHNGKQMIVK